jgi:hypothetical protein
MSPICWGPLSFEPHARQLGHTRQRLPARISHPLEHSIFEFPVELVRHLHHGLRERAVATKTPGFDQRGQIARSCQQMVA